MLLCPLQEFTLEVHLLVSQFVKVYQMLQDALLDEL